MGLGNPEPHHSPTRHNVGFRIVRAFAARHRFPAPERRYRGEYAIAPVFGRDTAVLLPLTFMNRSGEAVAEALAELTEIDPAVGMLVVFDDLDLEFGRIRLRARGSAGGQRGVQSIIDALGGEDFPRLRFGIGRPQAGRPVRDHVLEPFDATEAEQITPRIARAVDAIELALEHGISIAMDRFNRPEPPTEAH